MNIEDIYFIVISNLDKLIYSKLWSKYNYLCNNCEVNIIIFVTIVKLI